MTIENCKFLFSIVARFGAETESLARTQRSSLRSPVERIVANPEL